ncbi:MAG: hypothetical protein JNM31_14915 [Flavobacteriales bacterium]|nr:hypothetical protein [Flavobacteriales bacterium]
MRRKTPGRFLVRLKATMLAGLFLLMPFGVVLFLAFQVWKLMRKKMYALTDALGVGLELRLTTALLLAGTIIALAALIAGLMVRYGAGRKGRRYVERNLLRLLPGYGLMRLRMAEKLGQRSSRRTALLRTALGLQPVIVMERDSARALVFLPHAPGANNGTMVIVDPALLVPMNIAASELDDHLHAMGAGLLSRIPASDQP